MITAGMDFAWQFANVNFEFFDSIAATVKAEPYGRKFKFFYSTVDDYFKAVMKK